MPLAGGPCPLCADEALPPHVVLHPDQEPVLGEWCPHCLLPSAAAFPITARCVHGWPLGLTVPDVLACMDCGRQVGVGRP